jgi:hypothetical protein
METALPNPRMLFFARRLFAGSIATAVNEKDDGLARLANCIERKRQILDRVRMCIARVERSRRVKFEARLAVSRPAAGDQKQWQQVPHLKASDRLASA